MTKHLGTAFLLAAAAWAQSPAINSLPSREFGQLKLQSTLTSVAPNLVEGRELNGPSGIAFDTSVSPPIVYVADTFNNRVLAWQNASGVTKGNMADKVIGQRDLTSTLPQGPTTSLTTGLNSPVSVAVDSQGNLYVADAGNNRVLRYPAPFRQSGSLLAVDLVLGQPSVGATSAGNNNYPNQGANLPAQNTIYLSNNGTIYRSGLAFDSTGNLWFSDAGNNRVLRFPVSSLTPYNSNVSADMVLGQNGFVGAQVPQQPADNSNIQLVKTQLLNPSGIAFDASGRLYVADGLGRVLQFPANLTTGAAAARVLGIALTPAQGQQNQVYPAANTLGTVVNGNQIIGTPEGVFTIGNNVFVCDTTQNRVVAYGTPDTWTAETVASPSPSATGIVGQANFTSGKANQGAAQSSAASFNLPVSGAALGTDIWIVDTNNNRVLAFSQVVNLGYTSATRVLGQTDFNYNSPNLVEGRELYLYQGNVFAGASIVVDKNSNPPHLYVADSLNNRILGFRDARKIGVDARSVLTTPADIVIGQADLMHTTVNYPSGDPNLPTPTGLLRPVGLVVDASGNLYVADSGNGRVLRFPSPFLQGITAGFSSNLALGQYSLNSKISDASSNTMNTPYGLAQFSDGSLAVSDAVHNRILTFRKPAGGDFTTGQAAVSELGQTDFNSTLSSANVNGFNSPRHIATDTSDRLYVADFGNNRILIFAQGRTAANGSAAAFGIANFNAPLGVTVSSLTGQIWVTNSGSNQIVEFPEYQTLVLNAANVNAVITSYGPMALALDATDNLIVADASNRVTFYYAQLTYQHAASYNQQPLAPGQLAYLYRVGLDFSFTPAAASAYPWPTNLGDVQVLVNGVPTPVFRVNPTRIDFQVPSSAPTSGTAEFLVVRPSTGQIVAAGNFTMAVSSPGFFTSNAAGTGQIAALNQDGTVNGPGNPAARGSVIVLYGTGAGVFNNGPVDGMPPSAAASTPVNPKISMIPGPSSFLPDSDIVYSGAGSFPGGWQINVTIPQEVPPNTAVQVVLTMNDVPSNLGPTSRITTTIAVK